MTNSWDRAQNLAEKHKAGIFVRLQNDGEKIVGAFCGEPFAREVVWTGEGYETYDDKSPSHRGKRPSLKVLLNFFVPKEGAMRAIEVSAKTFEQILKCRDKYGLSAQLFELERHGARGDTKTRYSLLPDKPIDADLRAQIAAAQEHDLERLGNGDDDAGDGESDAPIEAAIAEELSNLLRKLPRAALDAFLGGFQVQRVRDLRASEEGRARAVLRDLEAKHAPRGEQDPFA